MHPKYGTWPCQGMLWRIQCSAATADGFMHMPGSDLSVRLRLLRCCFCCRDPLRRGTDDRQLSACLFQPSVQLQDGLGLHLCTAHQCSCFCWLRRLELGSQSGNFFITMADCCLHG